MDNMRIDVGVYTSITIDLSEFDLTYIEKVILTIKNYPDVKSEPVIEREFSESKAHVITITPEESLKLTENACYDFDKITLSGERYKITENGKVVLRKGVGDCIE